MHLYTCQNLENIHYRSCHTRQTLRLIIIRRQRKQEGIKWDLIVHVYTRNMCHLLRASWVLQQTFEWIWRQINRVRLSFQDLECIIDGMNVR